MRTLEHRYIDKSRWDDGPWHFEPDKRQWQDPETGYYCLILRQSLGGGLNGYVGLPPEHPAHGLHYDGITAEEAKDRSRRFSENTRAWAKAGYPPLDKWHKQHPIDYPPDDPFPGIGELVAAIEVHGGLSYAGAGLRPDEARWRKVRKGWARVLADAKRHPMGDSARYYYEWKDTITDYTLWSEKIKREYLYFETEPGEPTDLWIYGFDTGHAWDVGPAMNAIMEEIGSKIPRIADAVYRDLAYVEGQVVRLAKQLLAVTAAVTLLNR